MSKSGELVIVIWVKDLVSNRQFFSDLNFTVSDLSQDQVMAQLNDSTIVIQFENLATTSTEGQRGRGIELWFTVPDIRAQYEDAKAGGVRITTDLGNRGHSKQGDFSTETPDGYQITFY